MKPEVIVSTLALVVSTATAIWQIARYLLEGGRVRVRLYPIAKGNSFHGLFKNSAENWGGLDCVGLHESYFDELAVLEVENIGRTAVTVSDPDLEKRSIGWILTGIRVVMVNADVQTQEFKQVADRTHRLEPLDITRYVLSGFWGTYRSRRYTEPLETIRGSVRVAGKRTRQRTKRRNRWWLARNMPCFVGHNDLRRVAYVTLRKCGHSASAASAAADRIWEECPPGERNPTLGDIEKAIRPEKPNLDWLPEFVKNNHEDRLSEEASFVWGEISRFYFEHSWYKPCGRPITWLLVSWLNKRKPG